MSERSRIEWTDATWNPVSGCSKVSPGCAHCYAERISLRFGQSIGPWTPANAPANVRLHADRLDQPHRWQRPRMVFVNSMSDLFHELVPADFVFAVFDTMAVAERHTFQVLTKRPDRMRELVTTYYGRASSDPLPNVWLGVSIESSRWVQRADSLRATPAAVRFISAEPLLGQLTALDLNDIDWLIVGGESGLGHRPVEPAWVRDLRDRAVAAGVAFFFKQWGGRVPTAGGRDLDGGTWGDYPEVRTAERQRVSA